MDVRELPDEQVAYYRQILEAHGLDNGLCRVCHVLRCETWVEAFDKLAAAGQLMGKPEAGAEAAGAPQPYRNGRNGGRDDARAGSPAVPAANAAADLVSAAPATRPVPRTAPAARTAQRPQRSQTSKTSHASQILQSLRQAPRHRRSGTVRWGI
jgi:hypothetical protein